MLECTGIQEKKGSFENDKGKTIDYDNVMIYYISDEEPSVIGFISKELKVSKRQVDALNFEDWEELIGKQIEFRFNIFGSAPKLSGVAIAGDGVVTKFLGEYLSKQKQSS